MNEYDGNVGRYVTTWTALVGAFDCILEKLLYTIKEADLLFCFVAFLCNYFSWTISWTPAANMSSAHYKSVMSA